uniref:Uncharacterized protein n=1 Tax=Cherry twisted leaf associated virus TaxID=1424279 RepID=A0A0U2D8D7_9VIRU|nr:hypothetical protein [Cherry twisted leaf associated virus]
MLTFLGLPIHLVFLLLCMVCLAAGSQLWLKICLILRSLVLSLTVLLDLQILLGVVLKKLYNHYNRDSTFLTSIFLDLLTRALICYFPTLIRTSADHLLLISLTAILIGLALRCVNFLTY